MIGLFALLAVLGFLSTPTALALFAFSVPLVGIVSHLFHSPWISMQAFGFLGLLCGASLKATSPGQEPIGLPKPIMACFLAFAGLVAASGLVTALRFANFSPFRGAPFRDWIINSTGVLTTEAVNKTLTSGLAYICGIALLLLVYGSLGGSARCQRFRVQRSIAWAVVIAGLAANLFALWQVLSDRLLVIGFITGTYTDSNALGVCNALILPYSVGLILVSSGRSRAFLVACGLLSIAATVMARSRAGVVGIVLFSMAFALWFRRLDRGDGGQEGLPRRALRGFAVLAALLIIMLLLQDAAHLSQVPVFGDALLLVAGSSEASMEHLFQHRVHQWAEALRMCRDFPWTGVGLGAYIVELPNYYLRNEGQLFVIDTAGSLPLQIASELGILGFILALVLVVEVLRSSYRLLFARSESGSQSEQKLAGCISLGVMASLFTLLFGAHVLFFEYCFLLAISTGVLLASSKAIAPRSLKCSGGSLALWHGSSLAVVVTLVSVVLIAESLGPLSIEQRRKELGWQFEYGIYRREIWDGEFPFWWTQREASMTMTAKGDSLEFALFCAHPDADEAPVRASIFIDGNKMKTVELTRDRWTKVRLDSKTTPGAEIVLRVSVDRTFNPRALGIAEDARDLGVAFAKVRWLDSGGDLPT